MATSRRVHAATADSTIDVVIPMKLDAFVFNADVCSGGERQAKIAPITQPNYTFLRLNDHLAQNDILDHVDLWNSSPAARNPRFTDIGKAVTRTNRVGVYVHWSLPRPLRSGVAATNTAAPEQTTFEERADDTPPEKAPTKDFTAPRYQTLPNRWLVIRKIDPTTTVPANAPVDPVKAWIIESDKTRSIDKIPESADLQVDVSPFLTTFLEKGQEAPDLSIDKQAEIFIGLCSDAQGWKEQQDPAAPGAEGTTELRAGLTAANSSNPLFLDYQYHCSNVFAMVDTFEYREGGEVKRLTSANAHYYVVGWHSDDANDLMSAKNAATPDLTSGAQKRRERINTLRMKLNEAVPKSAASEIQKWLDDNASARSLCHGAMYDVEWDAGKPPKKIPADDYAGILMDKNPIAVGSTPMNTILSYVSAHHEDNTVEDSLYRLKALLAAEDESVDAHVAAMDEIQHTNYAHFDGGTQFALPGTGAGKSPTDNDKETWALINAAQKLKDATLRRRQQLRWDMFGWWWKFISDIDATDSRNRFFRGEIQKPKKEIANLEKLLKGLNDIIGTPKEPIKSTAMEDFHQRSDPTLMLAGVESGWPVDFNDLLMVRLTNQISGDESTDVPKAYGIDCLHPTLQNSARMLVREFIDLASQSSTDPPPENPADAILPLYHDGRDPALNVSKDNPWRDRWGSSQPWFPLYLEWDAEYSHIPFDAWSLMKPPAGSPANIAPKLSYKLNRDVARSPKDTDKELDVRMASGRSLILPQPTFSLKTHIDRLFSTVSESELDTLLGAGKRETLLNDLNRLAYLSVPFDGLTEHLITVYKGSHIKPLVRVPGDSPKVLTDAAEAAKELGLTTDELGLIDKESDPTPYGSIGSLVGHEICAFKPVTHGQLRLTKLNIIDKFGQVVHAMDPLKETPPAVYPVVSEEYAVDPSYGDPSKPNVVDGSRSTLDNCEFIQLPPSINQPARINAHFVVKGNMDHGEAYWRPMSQWDNPIWGWVVVNYVDNGLQFFLQDGTFYREVRATTGTTSDTLSWLPFQPPASIKGTEQLDYLIKKFIGDGGQAYLRAFMDMIMAAIACTVPTPTAYAQFLNSLVGRPLALAQMGWSLELNTKSKKNESTIDDQINLRPERTLLKEDGRDQYEFKVKFGDEARNYDGFVGYFDTVDPYGTDPPRTDGGDVRLDKIYTYYHSKTPLDGAPLTKITEENYPKLNAFWLDPDDYVPLTPVPDPKEFEGASRDYARRRDRQLQVKCALFDPFAPVTGFSSVLPIRPLQLPSWTWESALKKMTTFFHAGPLLLTQDVAGFNPKYELSSDKYDVGLTAPEAQVELPALDVAEWTWLQPYDLNSAATPMSYMAIEVNGVADEKPRWQKGPMTAVEGYMQLRAPIEKADTSHQA